tara:strand:+ start:157 stop:3030 length:2874 start_codon:yes stop_codon:yes gene_type:complete
MLCLSIAWSCISHGQQLEEIIVTAQKRAESLQDVSVSVTALGGEKLSDFGIARLEEITAYVPNFVMSETGIGTTIYIRGIGSGINQGFEQSVGMYRDGIYYGRAQLARAPIFDMERVEVLRGPQVTLFGNNSIGGAVSMAAAKPTDEFEGFIAGLHDFDHGEEEITAVLSGPLLDNLNARLSVRKYNLDGYLFNGTTDRFEPQRDYLTTRLNFQFTPESIDFFDANLILEKSTFDVLGRQILIFDDNPSIGRATSTSNFTQPPRDIADQTLAEILSGEYFPSSGGQQVIDANTFDRRFANNDYSINETESVTLILNFDLGLFDFKSTTGLLDYSYDDACDCDFSGATLIMYESDEQYSQKSQEFRITTSGDNLVDFIGGLYYQKDELNFRDALVPEQDSALTELLNGLQNSPDIAAAVDSLSGPRTFAQNSELLSMFSQFTFNVSEDFRVMAGLRKSNTKKDASRYLTFLQGDQESLLTAQQTIAQGNETLWNGSSYDSISSGSFHDVTYTACDDLVPGFDRGGDDEGIRQRAAIDCDGDYFFTSVVGSLLNLALNVSPHLEVGARNVWQTSYSLIFEWDINEDLMTYASKTRGYKSGGFDVRSNNPTDDSLVTDRNGNQDESNSAGTFVPGTFEFDDEESLAHEIGIKASIGDRLEINAAYFYNEIKNLQVSVFDGGVGFNVSNAASATTEGFELDGRFALTENIMLTGSIAWLDFEFDDYQDGVCTSADRLLLSDGDEGIDFINSFNPGEDGLYGDYVTYPDELAVFDLNGNGIVEFLDLSSGPPFQKSPEGEALQNAQLDNITSSTLINGNCRKDAYGIDGPRTFTADMTGKTNQYVSSYSGALSLLYENETSAGNFIYRAALDMNFTGPYHPTQNLDESVKQDGYEIYNVRLSLSPINEQFEISLIGRNIFDKQVITYANDVPLATSQFGTITKFGFLQRPKTWGLQAKYNFY